MTFNKIMQVNRIIYTLRARLLCAYDNGNERQLIRYIRLMNAVFTVKHKAGQCEYAPLTLEVFYANVEKFKASI